MKLARSAPVWILGMAGLGLAATTWLSTQQFAGRMAEVEAESYTQLRAIVEFNLQGAQDRALARAELLAGVPEIREAFALRDRDRLLADTREVYAVQHEKYGLDQVQFVTPDNVSFLRVHNPASNGDDLSTFRPIVVTVNRDHTAQKGISLTRSGPALMGVVPMTDNAGQPSGLVEFGLDFGPVLDKLKAAYGFDVAFFVKEEPLRTISTNVDKSVLDEHNRVGEYLKVHATNWDRMKPLVQGDDLAKVDGVPIEYTRDSLGVPYGVVMVSLHNAAGDPIGIVAAARDFSSTRSALGRSVVTQSTGALAVWVLLAGVVLVVIRGLLLRPAAALGEGMAALAKGDASKAIDGAPFCEELAGAAEAYEALRKAAEKGGGA